MPGRNGDEFVRHIREGSTMQDRISYEQARERVTELKAFYLHAVVFALVNLALFAIDMADSGPTWFYWPLLGWGIGLAAHAFTTFRGGALFGRDWEERQIRKIMERNR
jgi:hypothetical protein